MIMLMIKHFYNIIIEHKGRFPDSITAILLSWLSSLERPLKKLNMPDISYHIISSD